MVELPGAGPEENAAMAVPVRDTPCGEPGASSENSRLAVRWPGAMGLKTTERVQLAEGASAAVQLLVKVKSEGFGPESETDEMCSGAFPELVMVKVSEALEVPCVVAAKGGKGKESEGGLKLMPGTGVKPVPFKARVWGLPGALSAI